MAKQCAYERYSLNQGDFYADNGGCTACGAPQAEAPDLIEHAKEDNHCYFRKQPVTEAEIDRAIGAMMVSCVDALRYGGTDEEIIRRLYENGMAQLCDRKPQKAYAVVIRNKVSFFYTGTLQEIVDALKRYLLRITSHMVITHEAIDSDNRFRFVQRWYPDIPGSIYDGMPIGPQEMSIIVKPERGIADESAGRSCLLYDFLQQDDRISHVQWRSLDIGNTTIYTKPF
jgi:hypothetical protein